MHGENLLDHDAVDAHVFVAPGEVEQVDPAERQTQHQEAQVLLLPAQVQASWDQEEEALQETNHSRAVTNTLTGITVAPGNKTQVRRPVQHKETSRVEQQNDERVNRHTFLTEAEETQVRSVSLTRGSRNIRQSAASAASAVSSSCL